MAKIPLRAYVKEVERYIDGGEFDKAVTHAKNILKSYPKHIETYRLMGKAYLESQHYSEASDIFQRVLSVIPDDFMAQVGMSIIREDEKNLDAAVFHMERAYEVQPFNPAVQEELRRLYGRRDGVEPHRIRLTRGALIRMYARGDLYDQAIAETRAALSEDPQRLDLQVLLARLYFESGQTLEATEASSSLLNKLPYCYEANRILAEVLPGTTRSDDARKFQQRLYALEPYAAYLSPTASTVEQVPDQAVMVEHFAWDAEVDSSGSTDWAQEMSRAWDEDDDALPAWLDTLQPEAPNWEAAAAAAVAPLADDDQLPIEEKTGEAEDLLPDFMKEAGWKTADRPADEIMAEQEQQSDFLAGGDLSEMAADEAGQIEPAELPDWIQSIAPPQAESAGEGQRDEWLSSLLTEPAEEPAVPPPAEAGLPDWLTEEDLGLTAAAETGEETGVETSADVTTPSSEMVGAGATTESDQAIDFGDGSNSDLPEWLRTDPETGQPAPSLWTPEPSPSDPAEPVSDDAGAVPDWLKDFTAETPLTPQQPSAEQEAQEYTEPDEKDWFLAVESGETIETAMEASLSEETNENHGSLPDDIPDWLQGFGEEADAVPADLVATDAAFPEASSSETAAVLPDEDSLTGGARAYPLEEAETGLPQLQDTEPPVETDTAALDAASLAQAGRQEQPAPETKAEQAAAPDFEDMDAALAWMESLAARQGADDGTLITPPEDRLETPPGWVQAAQEVQEQPETVQLEAEASEPSSDEEQAAAKTQPVAVHPAEENPAVVELIQEEQALPDWVKDLFELETSTTEAADAVQESAVEPDRARLEWVPEQPDELDEPQDPQDLHDIAALEPDEGAEAPELWQPEAAGETAGEQAGELTLPAAPLDVTGFDRPAQPESHEEFAAFKPLAETSQWEQDTEAADVEAADVESAVVELSAEGEDMDAAFAWMESLAARQGAEDGTLLTQPEDRQETPPDWVQEQTAQPDAVVAESAVEAGQDQVPDWLASLESEDEDAADIGTAMPELTSETLEIPWETQVPAGETNMPDSEPEPLDWLRQIEKESGTAAVDADMPAAANVEPAADTTSREIQAQTEGDQVEAQFEAGDQPDAVEFETLPAWLESIQEDEELDLPRVSEAYLPEEVMSADALPASQKETPPVWVEQPEAVQPPAGGAELPAAVKEGSLEDAQNALLFGKIDTALSHYTRFIEQGQHLEQTIHDLRDALYRYPVDIDLWQALGDAYARNDQLQEALDAYTKAEELLR